MSNNSKNIKFLSNDNATYIIDNIRKKLCITEDPPNNNFVKTIVRIMERINDKYPNNNINELNNITMDKIIEYYQPEKDVKKVIYTKYLPTEPLLPNTVKHKQNRGMKFWDGDILKNRVTGIDTGIQTELQRIPIGHHKITVTPEIDENNNNENDVKKIDRQFFFDSGKTEFRSDTKTFQNIDNNLFYNPDISTIYDPTNEIFYNSDTGEIRPSGTKYTDVEVFFGFKKSDITQARIDTGSRLGYYDSKTGGILHPEQHERDNIAELIRVSRSVTDTVTITEYTIAIDSRHRDIRIFPSSSRYTIGFQNRSRTRFGFINNMSDIIRGTIRIELIDGSIPNILKDTGESHPESYLLLSVDEITGRYFNSSPQGRNIFGKLKYDLYLHEDVNFLNIIPVMAFRDFNPNPLSTAITSLSINILNFNGNLVDFGQDSFQVRYWQDSGANTTIITTWLPHGLTTGNLIYFRFTENRILDTLLDGIPVLVVSPTVFTVPIDSSSVAAGIAPNIGGPPTNPDDPENSPGDPFPTVPPNDPENPNVFYGFILRPELQNSFVFKIITEEKTGTQISKEQLASISSGY
jgi:hypothetical protein